VGARRHIVEGLVAQFARPEIHNYFSGLRIADEFVMASLLMQLVRRKGPMNHIIQRYHEAHVGEFAVEDLGILRNSPAWFGRKFPDNPQAPVRLQVLQDLARVMPATAAKPAPVFRPRVSA
jgi:hypothetical protein